MNCPKNGLSLLYVKYVLGGGDFVVRSHSILTDFERKNEKILSREIIFLSNSLTLIKDVSMTTVIGNSPVQPYFLCETEVNVAVHIR